MKKVTYRTNRDNRDYLSISRDNFCTNLLNIMDKDDELLDEANKIYAAMWSYKKGGVLFISNDINIRKDSSMGEYIVANNYDLEDYISFNRIVNAMNIAIYEDNAKITNRLARLFKERVEGDKKELEKLTKTEVIDYIISHDNLKEFLDKTDGTYIDKKYYVYEDGKIVYKTLNNKGKVKVKTVV